MSGAAEPSCIGSSRPVVRGGAGGTAAFDRARTAFPASSSQAVSSKAISSKAVSLKAKSSKPVSSKTVVPHLHAVERAVTADDAHRHLVSSGAGRRVHAGLRAHRGDGDAAAGP